MLGTVASDVGQVAAGLTLVDLTAQASLRARQDRGLARAGRLKEAEAYLEQVRRSGGCTEWRLAADALVGGASPVLVVTYDVDGGVAALSCSTC